MLNAQVRGFLGQSYKVDALISFILQVRSGGLMKINSFLWIIQHTQGRFELNQSCLRPSLGCLVSSLHPHGAITLITTPSQVLRPQNFCVISRCVLCAHNCVVLRFICYLLITILTVFRGGLWKMISI